MKRICLLLLAATVLFLFQLACRSSNQANAPANTATQSRASNTTPPPGTDVVPNQNAAAPAASNAKPDSQFTELIMLYSQLFTARMKNDKAKVEGLLADSYKETTADGKALNKSQVLAEITPDKKVDTYTLDNLKSTAEGETGTVTGRATVAAQGKTESWQFSTTFKKEQGRWLAVSTKITDYKKS